MRNFLTILVLSVSAAVVSSCGSEAAENANQVIVNTETANANTAPASEPVPIFADAQTALAEGNKYFETNQTEKAIEAYKQAVALDPDFAEAHFRLGVAYSLLEKEEEATRLPGEQTEPTPKNRKKEPEKTESQKAFETAIELYNKIVKKDPENAVAFYNLGRSYNKLNEDEDAAKALRKAVKLNPDSGEYQTELGEALIRLAEYDEAVRALKKALEIDENNLQAEDLLEKAEAGRRRIEFGKKQIQQSLERENQSSSRSGSRSKRDESDEPEDTSTPDEPRAKPEKSKSATPKKEPTKKDPGGD